MKYALVPLAVLLVAAPAFADYANGPDPYAPGFGFDTPTEASWGGWTRGDAGTAYAEWDSFSGTAGTPLAASWDTSGTASTGLTWNAGTFPSSTGNLYNFSGASVYDIDITPAAAFSGPVTLALQFETWGTEMDYTSILLNGVAADSGAVTFVDPAYASSFGPVKLTEYVALWTLDAAPENFHIDMQTTGPHQSFAQVAVDIGAAAAPVPEASEWGMMLSGLGLVAFAARRKQRHAGLA